MTDDEIYELCSSYVIILLNYYHNNGYNKKFKEQLDNINKFKYLKPYTKFLEKITINIFYGQNNTKRYDDSVVKENFTTYLKNSPGKKKDNFIRKVRRNIILNSLVYE